MMAGALRLLIIEDSEDDSLLTALELRKGGFDPDITRVETLQELAAALESDSWDAVIADFNLPGFTGLDALRAIQAKGLDLPFILVSGAIGEEMAAEVMKAGAHDYISKGNYARLAPSLERVLREAEIRHERKQTAEELTRYREHLEEMVQERTVELKNANEALQAEIDKRKQAEATLEHFASFPLLNPTPIIEMDSDGKVTFCNSAAEKLLGKEACLDSSNPLIPRELPDVLRYLQQKKVSQSTRTVEIGDLVFDVLIYLTPQFNSVRIYAMDITERRRLEEDRSRLAAIVENSDDAIIAKTLDGIIVDWNKGAEKLYGYTASEIKGRLISTLVPADRFDEVPQILEKIGRGEIAEHIETIRVTKDGRHIPVSLAISPIKDTYGKITGASTIAHDITERKRTEQALRESEERLHLAIDATGLGTFDYYPLTGAMIWSEGVKRHFGLPPDAQVDYDVFLTGLHPDDRERVDGFIQKLLNPVSGGGYSTEYRSIGLQDGKERWIAARGRMFYDETGRAVRFVGTTLDISERKLAEEKIEELNTNLAERAGELALANQELEAFNYSVAHDLRNPLNVISSYCQVIKELCGNQLDLHCKEYLQEAYNGTLRMNRLIDALLKFSRLAHAELRRETVDLSGMAQAVAMELKLAEPGRRVEFRIADGVSAEGDAAILRVLLDNLLGNAWKYTGTREEGIIEFGATEVDGKPAWFVRDNGAGFDMADAEKLFIPFQRLPGVEEFRGSGIGLATVERIIRRHGGRVWAEGEPGKGATFYFTLANGRE